MKKPDSSIIIIKTLHDEKINNGNELSIYILPHIPSKYLSLTFCIPCGNIMFSKKQDNKYNKFEKKLVSIIVSPANSIWIRDNFDQLWNSFGSLSGLCIHLIIIL